jgi:hypothetical protein
MITLILHRWEENKFLRLDDLYIRRTAYLLTFGGYPATLHLTRDDVDDFLFELENEFGMNVSEAKIVEIKMPTLAEQFLLEEYEGNIKEIHLQYDPIGTGKNKE